MPQPLRSHTPWERCSARTSPERRPPKVRSLNGGSAAQLEARLANEGLVGSTWGNAAGDTYAAHSHGYDKVLVAVRGSITFHLVDISRDVLLEAGERLDLPAGTRHAATVGPGGVTCLEAHLAAGTLGGRARHRAAAEW